MTDKEALLILCKIYFKLHSELAMQIVKKAITALNFKMEVERFAEEEEWPEYFDANCRELIEQIKEGENNG